MRMHLHTYPAGFYYSNIQSGNETTTTKSQTHTYVSPSAENDPAMARPARLVPVPMESSGGTQTTPPVQCSGGMAPHPEKQGMTDQCIWKRGMLYVAE